MKAGSDGVSKLAPIASLKRRLRPDRLRYVTYNCFKVSTREIEESAWGLFKIPSKSAVWRGHAWSQHQHEVCGGHREGRVYRQVALAEHLHGREVLHSLADVLVHGVEISRVGLCSGCSNGPLFVCTLRRVPGVFLDQPGSASSVQRSWVWGQGLGFRGAGLGFRV